MNSIEGNPFDMGYVLKTTAKHMRKSIDISIEKTGSRIAEFSNDLGKSREILSTLSVLYNMRKQLDNFQAANSESFRGSK